jgi:hypothetical protein
VIANMANTLNQDQLAQVVSAVLQALNTSTASPKAPSISAPGNSLEAKDRSLIAGFKRRGITDVVLMDRADKSKPFNVKPFKGWLEQGRMVKKGEKSIKGLFHISQTSELPKASAKPAITAEQKTLFETAKKVLKAKKAKAQPRPAA